MPEAAIGRNDILRAYPAAARSRQVLEAAVLDAAFDVLLSEMCRRRLFEEFHIVFKGGTALRKLRFGHKSRFSFDLDFDVEEGADEIFAEEITGHASSGFCFEVEERRGHSYLRIDSDLLPGGAYRVKVDFSRRGCWLPPERLRPLTSPALHEGIWGADAAIPTMRLDEQIAEKLSRWQRRQLVRDLHDVATAYHLVEDEGLVAKMYVLKSHKSRSSMLAGRRPQQAARPLAEVTDATHPNHFVLDDLVLPSMRSEADKVKRSRPI